jgi:GT2 family glycosyltransferase
MIAVDSGSADGSPEFLEGNSFTVRKISAQQFGHGKTRNLLASMASGDVFVFLNQDAIPANSNWLSELIKGLHFAPDIVGACSLEVNEELGINNGVSRFVFGSSSPEQGIWVQPRYDAKTYSRLNSMEKRYLFPFSTVSAAVKAEYFLRNPFFDNVYYGEDLQWAVSAYKRSFRIACVSSSQVFHWHSNQSQSMLSFFSGGIEEGLLFKKLFHYKSPFKNDIKTSLPPILKMTELKIRQHISRILTGRNIDNYPNIVLPWRSFYLLGMTLASNFPLCIIKKIEKIIAHFGHSVKYIVRSR